MTRTTVRFSAETTKALAALHRRRPFNELSKNSLIDRAVLTFALDQIDRLRREARN